MGDGGNSPPSCPDHDGADSDGYSHASKVVGGQQRQKRQRNEKHLAPVCLDMPIFKTMDPTADVTYTIWKFDIECWLDQYDEVSMMLHIYHSLQGYPGCAHWRWVKTSPHVSC